MPDVCLVFYLHHAERLKHVRAFDDDQDFDDYVDETATAESLRELSRESFLPALRLLRDAVTRGEGSFRVGVVPTGPLLRSARRHNAPLMRAMHQLNETQGVEWVASPADGSVLSLQPGDHFQRQLADQADALAELFGRRPTTACDTQFLYDNTTADRAAGVGDENRPLRLRRPRPRRPHGQPNLQVRPAGRRSRSWPATSASATTGARASATATGPATRSRPRPTPTGWPAAWRRPAARSARSSCTCRTWAARTRRRPASSRSSRSS